MEPKTFGELRNQQSKTVHAVSKRNIVVGLGARPIASCGYVGGLPNSSPITHDLSKVTCKNCLRREN